MHCALTVEKATILEIAVVWSLRPGEKEDRLRKIDGHVSNVDLWGTTAFTSNHSDEGSQHGGGDTEETYEVSGSGVTKEILKKIDIVV